MLQNYTYRLEKKKLCVLNIFVYITNVKIKLLKNIKS